MFSNTRFTQSNGFEEMKRLLRNTVCLLTLVCLATTAEVKAASIHRQLQKHVPQIVEYLNNKGLKTVGVLKFRVKKSDQKLSDSVGPLNSLIADRLEVGLILGNPFDESRQLNIIRDASSQVADIPAASHLSDEGRAAFFDHKFELAWGSDHLKADAFLTGIVQVHDDNATCSIGVLCFDKSGGKLERCCDVMQAELDASSMGELGESFVLRGAFDGGSTKLKKEEKQESVVKQAAAVKTQLAKFPLADSSAPVKLEVRYDGKLMAVETRDGKAFIPEPKEGQMVEMAIVRGTSAKGTLGVVLRVNGENTLGRQTVSDLECRKWLLTPTHTKTVIRGYQIEGKDQAEQFSVLSDEESKTRAVDYGRHVGQIQLTVFKEMEKDPNDLPPGLPSEDEEDLVAMLRGVQPKKTPSNLSALKGQIRSAGRETQTRGLIVAGDKTESRIRQVSFEPDPTPVMSATVTYYTP